MAREMKDSGIEWIGEIPSEWHVEKHKYLFSCGKEIVGEASASTQLLSLTTQGVKLKSSDAVGGKLPESFDTYQTVEKDNLIMCLFDLDCSAVFSGLSPFYGMISPAYKVLKCSNKILPVFADCWFKFVFDGRKFKSYAKNLRYTLNYDEFACIPLALPSLQEQQRIADFLDRKCAEIDSVIAETQKTIEEYKALKQSIITEAVTKGIRGDRPMKDSGIEWIGDIPEEWSRRKICHYSKFYNGDRTSRYPKPEELQDNGIPFLSSREINDDIVNISNTKYISEEKYASLSGAKLQIGDIVFCLRGSIGKCAINLSLDEGTVASSLMTIRPSGIDGKYLLYFLLSDMVQIQTTLFMNGTCAANLSAENVGGYILLVPPISEQQEIVDYLDEKCAEITLLIAAKQSLLEDLESYKKSVIYEYVTGKKEVPIG